MTYTSSVIPRFSGMLRSLLAFAAQVSRMTLGRFLLARAVCDGNQSFDTEAHTGVIAPVGAVVVAAVGELALCSGQTLHRLGQINHDTTVTSHYTQYYTLLTKILLADTDGTSLLTLAQDLRSSVLADQLTESLWRQGMPVRLTNGKPLHAT